jgi:hypothetical protein
MFDPSLSVILVIVILSLCNTRWSDFTRLPNNGPTVSPIIRVQKIGNEIDSRTIDDKVKIRVAVEMLKFKANNSWDRLKKIK